MNIPCINLKKERLTEHRNLRQIYTYSLAEIEEPLFLKGYIRYGICGENHQYIKMLTQMTKLSIYTPLFDKFVYTRAWEH